MRHTIERHHGDDHEVPWARSVGCGYNDSQTDGRKDDQCLHHRKLCREGEAEEGDVELKEVAHPYTYRIEEEQSLAMHGLEREQAIDEATYGLLHLGI